METENFMDGPKWLKMEKDIEPIDGEFYVLAFYVHHKPTDKWAWEIEKVQAISYDDGPTLYQGDEAFDSWEFWDAEFYIKC